MSTDKSKKEGNSIEEKSKQSQAEVPEYKIITPEYTWDELQTPTSNLKIPDYIRRDYSEFVGISSLGEDTCGLVSVPNFILNNAAWSDKVPDELLKLPHISKSDLFPQPETVCGNDDRTIIGNTTVSPWKFICKVYIDNTWVASGFFIGPKCIITNGHVVFPNGNWANRITVVPGQNGGQAPFGSQISSRFMSVAGWTNNRNPDYDYGAIILPDDQLYRRIQGFMGYQILNSSHLLNNSGYPGDKPNGTQWYNAGAITTLGARRFFYMIDTAGGQSGSPVFIGPNSSPIAVGVHGYGGCPNSAVRLIADVAANWTQWRQL